MELLQRVDDMGGATKAIAASFFQEEIAKSAYAHQMSVEKGEKVIVGVNKFTDGSAIPEVVTPDFSKLEREQVARLAGVRAKRDATKCTATLDQLGKAAQGFGSSRGASLMRLIVDAVRARASVGEIATILRGRWGAYKP
jgi:methylmalonyl-CoA mutase N-terminal domain/subunit